ncbi:MAG TPA: hypothetical protein VMQ11_05255 [Alphaproteobacteria bacterium]|nr:hypothetical protein [Alphaproteobacteria bacterium]
MASQDSDKATARRLDELEQRLEGAFRSLSGHSSVAAREGESLRARRARLREQLQGGSTDPSVTGEINALSEEIEAWIGRLDRDQTRDDVRTGHREH